MKISILTVVIFLFGQLVNAQNVGIGTTTPKNKLVVEGDFSVHEALMSTLQEPTAEQQKTMVNGTNLTFNNPDRC